MSNSFDQFSQKENSSILINKVKHENFYIQISMHLWKG